MSALNDAAAEWLETDGLGGFASGTAGLVRTRRYHALLLVAAKPPGERYVLVNGLDAWVKTPSGHYPLSSQRYDADVVYPDGANRVIEFSTEPWPHWVLEPCVGTLIEHDLLVPHLCQAVILRWRQMGTMSAVLQVRLLFSGRDYHSLHHENPEFQFEPKQTSGRLVWRPYPGVPGVIAEHSGSYRHDPVWYRNFYYSEERARGLDYREDLASPGILEWDLSVEAAVLVLEAANTAVSPDEKSLNHEAITARVERWRHEEEKRRESFPSRLHRSADAYLVCRGNGRTIIAGYPWFTDWGRDTFIAVRGLCIAAGRLDEARDVLLAWAETVSAGMLPNRFPDYGESPEFNSVDASLWYIIAVHDYLCARNVAGTEVPAAERATFREAIDAVLAGCAAGTRYGIQLDMDGLLAAGEPGQQLTWMDARVNGHEITPRIGKPVEVQALWLNALAVAGAWTDRWNEVLARGQASFAARFIGDEGHLYDVVDVDHQPGKVDPTLRPNQVFAVGGLPFALLQGDVARRIVEVIEAKLWTPLGLRSLDPEHPDYHPSCIGSASERDGAYHQGTVWPWLLGAFVEAWVRVHGGTPDVLRQARERFLNPVLEHLGVAGLGHISEITDGSPPHTPRGCPFQAWSVGEVLRLMHGVLAKPSATKNLQ